MGETLGQPASGGDAPQRALLDRLVAALGEDERILAAWVIGSLARGDADAYSDVDVLVAVRAEDFAALVVD